MTVTPGAPYELAWAVQRLASDQPLQERLVQNALRYAQANSWQLAAERTASIYEQVLSRHGGGTRGVRLAHPPTASSLSVSDRNSPASLATTKSAA